MQEVFLKGTPFHIEGRIPQSGDAIPKFTVIDTELKEVTLPHTEKEYTILCFVPSLDTEVCLASAKKFNEVMAKKTNVNVCYISADLPFALKRVCDSFHLKNITTYSLMNDRGRIKNLGLIMQDGPLKGLCSRCVIIIDQTGKVIFTSLNREITEEPNYNQVLEQLH